MSITSKLLKKIQLKGFAVGNGCTHPDECGIDNHWDPFEIQNFREMGIIHEKLYR